MNNWDSIILDGAWRLTLIHDADLRTMQQDVIQAVREEKLPAIPATVPGNFELDLQAAGQLPDVFFGDNILKLDAYEDCHLLYFRRFQFEAKEGTAPRLVFEGIDTYADVYVNGRLVYECDNMLIPHTGSGGMACGRRSRYCRTYPPHPAGGEEAQASLGRHPHEI